MPTIPERIATLEGIAQDLRRRIDALHADIHSGPGVEWPQSVRGRMHAMSEALAAADKLAEAARELRRAKDAHRSSRIKTWQWSVIAASTIALAAAPYIVPLLYG